MKKLVFVALILGTLPALAGFGVADLERMASRDLIPEIRLAAGYALVNYYAAHKTEAELLDLAKSGASEAVRMAASLALSQKLLDAGKSREELMQIITEDPSSEVRAAVVPALMTAIIGDDAEALLELAKTGSTEELQYAAAKAYFQKTRATFNREKLEEICADETLPAGFRKAAAEFLAGHYLFPLTTALSREELEKQALENENPYLRYAAAVALLDYLVKESADDLYKELVALFLAPGVSEEYRWAYARALGIKWAEGL